LKKYLNTYVRFTGKTSGKNLVTGNIYAVAHVYSGNVCIRLARDRFVSLQPKHLQIIDTASIPLQDNSIEVSSVLMLDTDIVGLRCTSKDVPHFDIEMDKLMGVELEDLSCYKVEELKPYEHLLMTESEYTNNELVMDLSSNQSFCAYIIEKVTCERMKNYDI
jgi:hypothetical protein